MNPRECKRILGEERGYSLVEMMISGAVLAISIVLVAYQQTSQFRAQRGITMQGQGREILQQILSKITQDQAQFLPLQNSTEQGYLQVVYIGCFDSTGVARDHDYSYSGMKTRTGFIGLTVSSVSSAHTEVCSPSKPGYEVHVVRSADNKSLDVHVILIGTTEGSGAAGTKYWKATVGLDA